VRLADVLLAYPFSTPKVQILTDGRLHIFVLNHGATTWNLRDDTLDEQSNECLTFLTGLLE
jgi:hypothetical protein